MQRLVHFALALLLTTGIPIPAANLAHADEALIARGYAIARVKCHLCHAIGKDDVSANPKSPPFRTLSRKYPLGHLEEAFVEGIIVGHKEGQQMPHFRFDPPQIDALIAYLASIQTP
jgi:cytochrome c